MVADAFWGSFFLFLIFVPLTMVWAFALVDIFRRDDLGGGSKALWVACVILVPFLGTLIYLITRPSEATRDEQYFREHRERELVQPYSPPNGVAELQRLAELHDRGKLTDNEFAAEKARLLGAGSTMPV